MSIEPSARRMSAMVILLALAGIAEADTSTELRRCSAIDASEARLACYDKLAGRAPEHASATVAVAPPPPAASKEADPVRDFGLTKAQLEKSQPPSATPEGPSEIKAVVTSIGGHAGQTVVTLDNGQSWSFSDDDARLSAGDHVTIRRAALGNFMMITPSRHTHYVHRAR